jgi:hypothetical protein
MLATLLLLATVQAAPPADARRIEQCRARSAASTPPTTARGRLYAANGGGSGFRIWLVGTSRIVWITPKIDPAVPREIRDRFKPFDEELYGNFTFVPLRPDQPGVMREVCLVSGEKLTARPARGRP